MHCPAIQGKSISTHPEALDGAECLVQDDGAAEQQEDLPEVEEAELAPRADVAPTQGVVVVVVVLVAQAGGARLEEGPRAAEEEEGGVQLLVVGPGGGKEG